MIQKLALNSFNDNLNGKFKTLDSSHLTFLPHKDNDKSGILEPVVGTTLLVNNMLCKIFSELINPNFNCKTICNHIHDILPFNTMQKLVVEGIINHIIRNKGKMHFATNRQLLLYLHREKGVEKSCMVKTLEIRFVLLDR